MRLSLNPFNSVNTCWIFDFQKNAQPYFALIAFVPPEMLQNKILSGVESGEAVAQAAARMREVIA